MTTNPKEKLGWKEDLAEYGALHNEDCCVNFEDSRACDVGTGIVECCENMKMIASFVSQELAKAKKEGYQEGIGDNARFKVEIAYEEGFDKGLEKGRREVLEIIKNGGTGDTILTIIKNSDLFIHQRQLIKAVENLKGEDKK